MDIRTLTGKAETPSLLREEEKKMKVSYEHIEQIKRDYYSLGINNVMSLEQYMDEQLEQEQEEEEQ